MARFGRGSPPSPVAADEPAAVDVEPLLSPPAMPAETPGSVRSPALEIAAMISLWYGASVVATNTSKALGVHWSVLTACQLSVATGCSLAHGGAHQPESRLRPGGGGC